ncbi:MAG: class I SAM-dependent methyltransferase [Chloroflexota bacterium]
MHEHEINQAGWNKIAVQWAQRPRAIVNWEACRDREHEVLRADEQQHLGDIVGKRICVLGSGDNLLVFRFAKLGAQLTSVDISQGMLDIAIDRAAGLGLDITFIQADVVDLQMIEDNQFDIVYTGGHVSLWVCDLKRYFAEAVRILRPGGTFMIKEYHPFRYLWKEQSDKLELAHDYYATGPFAIERADDIPSYVYHWTVSDYVTAMLQTGCVLPCSCSAVNSQPVCSIAVT